MDSATYLDEFRPFRRGELALAARLRDEPLFLPPAEAGLLRYALRLAQLSALGSERDSLVLRIGSARLRLLQLLAPVLPTDPRRLVAKDLFELLPRVAMLVDDARRTIVERELVSEQGLDAEIARKRLVLVLGGAAGASYIFLGVLQRLEELGLVPDYLFGCSMGAVLAVVRARARRFEVGDFYTEVGHLRARAFLRPPGVQTRFGLPGALRLDLRRALGSGFRRADGSPMRLRELAIPVDVLATGLGAGALMAPREEYAHLVPEDLNGAPALAELRGSALARAVSALVSLAMSRRVLTPVVFGADSDSGELAALDAAGYSAAVPGLLHYDLTPDDPKGDAILAEVCRRGGIAALVDGALTSVLPARFAWEAIEAGRIGGRHAAIVALDPLGGTLGPTAVLAPLVHAFAAAAHPDRAYCDLHVRFRRSPSLLELAPREERLRRAQLAGEREFEASAGLLRSFLAPVPPWRELRARIPPR